MALRKLRQTWYIYFRDLDGTLRTRSLKTRDESVARYRHEQYMAAVNQARFDLVLARVADPDAPAPVKVPTLVPEVTQRPGDHQRGGIAIADMWECASKKRALTRTHRIYWRPFLADIGVKYADQVTPKIALDYLESHYSGGNGKNFNNARSALNTVFRCCLVEAGLEVSPFAPIVNKMVTKIEHHRNLTEDEFNRACASAPMHLRIMMMLSRWTCQRLETCARMTPAMFDFTRLVFLIDPGKTARFKKWVCCPIMPPLEVFIKPILAQCKDRYAPIIREFYPAWKSVNNNISHDIRDLFQKIGIKDTDAGKASFHSIRGTAITWFKEHGISGDALRYMTGHASDAVEDIYARPVKILSDIAKKSASELP